MNNFFLVQSTISIFYYIYMFLAPQPHPPPFAPHDPAGVFETGAAVISAGALGFDSSMTVKLP